jgi:integrase/recombinase XerD
VQTLPPETKQSHVVGMVGGARRRRAGGGRGLTISAALALFRDHHVKAEGRLAPKTLMDYGRDFAQFAAFLAKTGVRHVRTVVRGDVLRYLEHLTSGDVSQRAQARYLCSIRMIFAFLMTEGLMTSNPVAGIAGPQFQPGPPRVLDRQDILKLLDAHDRNSPFGTRNAAMVALLYGTGLRISELLGLPASSVDFFAGQVRAGTGCKERVFLFSDETYLVLRTYFHRARERILAHGRSEAGVSGKASPLFVSRQGGTIAARTFARILAATARRAGVRKDLSSHSLRHSFAAHLVEGGVDLRVVQAMLGHATMKSTEVYARVSKVHRRRPA